MDLDVGVLESACLFVFGRFAPVLLGKGREGSEGKTVKELEKRPARHKSLIAWRIQTPYWLDASGRVAEESRKQQEPNIKPPHFSGIIQMLKLREKERAMPMGKNEFEHPCSDETIKLKEKGKKTMPKKKPDNHITDSAIITAALLRIYEPLLDAPLPEDHTGPDPEYHNRSFDIAFQAIIASVHGRFEGAEEYLSRAEKNYEERIEADPKMRDIRTVFATEATAKAQKAFTAAVEMRKAFSDAYELMSGKIFDRAEWQASFDSAPRTSKSADRAKAAAEERAAAIAKREALGA